MATWMRHAIVVWSVSASALTDACDVVRPDPTVELGEAGAARSRDSPNIECPATRSGTNGGRCWPRFREDFVCMYDEGPQSGLWYCWCKRNPFHTFSDTWDCYRYE